MAASHVRALVGPAVISEPKEPSETGIFYIEAGITRSIEELEARNQHVRLSTAAVVVSIPTTATTWQVFNYLCRVGYEPGDYLSFGMMKTTRIDLTNKSLPASITYDNYRRKRDQEALQSSRAFFEQPNNCRGVIEYDNAFLAIYRHYAPEGSYELAHLKVLTARQVAFERWPGGLLIRIQRASSYSWEENDPVITKRLIHYVKLSIKLLKVDLRKFKEYKEKCYDACRHGRRLPKLTVISKLSEFVLSRYGYNELNEASLDAVKSIIVDRVYIQSDCYRIVNPIVPTMPEFCKALWTILVDVDYTVNIKRKILRQAIVDEYMAERCESAVVANGDTFHWFRSRAALNYLLSQMELQHVAKDVSKAVSKYGVERECEVRQHKSMIIVKYKAT